MLEVGVGGMTNDEVSRRGVLTWPPLFLLDRRSGRR